MKGGYVYILTNYKKTTLYIGVTSNLKTRISQHKDGNGSAFTTKYNCKYLIYYEFHNTITEAIEREKQLKNWHREWKFNLIKSINPNLTDLSYEI
ncbi:MAG TPA: GIY-YIG nuclease family protein [Cytophagales bacterium]|nr:GIY-YIG nuclease family protein [Cytophagales bacterium]